STPVAKLLLGTIDPWLLAGLLYASSGFGLMAILFVRHGRGAFASIARPDIPWLAGAIAAGGVVGPVLPMFGLSSIQASTASLLLGRTSIRRLGPVPLNGNGLRRAASRVLRL